MSESQVMQLEETGEPSTQLQKLNERHKTAAALVAQGVPRATVAQAVQYAPEYITWLQRQPVFIAYVREMNAAAAVQLEAMFAKSVTIIAEGMDQGGEVALKAAKMQLEATGRLGRERSVREGGDPGVDRLGQLANRLIDLLQDKRRRTFNEEGIEISQA